jgi:2-keto-4-pentenoate hydratase/2-oxohepta-3-ene-1,7-dioic acid hydratase in catechol pathway
LPVIFAPRARHPVNEPPAAEARDAPGARMKGFETFGPEAPVADALEEHAFRQNPRDCHDQP